MRGFLPSHRTTIKLEWSRGSEFPLPRGHLENSGGGGCACSPYLCRSLLSTHQRPKEEAILKISASPSFFKVLRHCFCRRTGLEWLTSFRGQDEQKGAPMLWPKVEISKKNTKILNKWSRKRVITVLKKILFTLPFLLKYSPMLGQFTRPQFRAKMVVNTICTHSMQKPPRTNILGYILNFILAWQKNMRQEGLCLLVLVGQIYHSDGFFKTQRGGGGCGSHPSTPFTLTQTKTMCIHASWIW